MFIHLVAPTEILLFLLILENITSSSMQLVLFVMIFFSIFHFCKSKTREKSLSSCGSSLNITSSSLPYSSCCSYRDITFFLLVSGSWVFFCLLELKHGLLLPVLHVHHVANSLYLLELKFDLLLPVVHVTSSSSPCYFFQFFMFIMLFITLLLATEMCGEDWRRR